MKPYRAAALLVASKIRLILENRGLDPHVVQYYDLWKGHGGTVWLSAILNTDLVEKSERYTDKQTLHHLSTALKGKPVILSNHSGIRYCVLLSHRPELPKVVMAPPWRKGVVQIGQSLRGAITAEWNHDEHGIGHVLTAAMNRYGKSTLLKHLAFQALQEGFQLALVDPRGATFDKLRGHSQVLAYTGTLEESVAFLATDLLGLMDERAPIHQQHGVDKFEKLPEGTLPRLVILIDEYNEILRRAEGKQRKAVSDAVVTMAFGSPKYGVHLVVAGHYFQKEDADRLKDQFITKIVFRLESKEAARMLLDSDAPTRIWEKGRAMTNRWGLIQTYYAELDEIPAHEDGLTETERGLIQRLKAEHQGRLSYPALFALGYKRTTADKLREDFRRRGLAKPAPDEDNTLILTM